ncbi:MAG: helix-turn-helix domain-containing protein [Balneolaceae bacterium]
MSFFTVFLVIGLSYSLLILIKYLSALNKRRVKDLTISILIAILSVEIFYGVVFNSGFILNYPFLIRLNTPIILLAGPAVYFLFRSDLDPHLRLKWAHSLHIIPSLACFLYFTPLYAEPSYSKVLYIKQLYSGLGFDSLLWGGIRRVQQFAYLFVIYYLLSKSYHWKGIRHLLFKSPVSFYVISFFSLLWITSILRYFLGFTLFAGNIDLGILSIFVIALTIYLFSLSKGTFGTKYHSSSLSMNDKINLMTIIRKHVENEKLFLDASLSLPGLSKITGIPVPKISQTINQELGYNFNAYLNHLRIEEARQNLILSKNQHLTIEAIAKDAGYGSISSFNTNFKKLIGTNPSEYRKRLIL